MKIDEWFNTKKGKALSKYLLKQERRAKKARGARVLDTEGFNLERLADNYRAVYSGLMGNLMAENPILSRMGATRDFLGRPQEFPVPMGFTTNITTRPPVRRGHHPGPEGSSYDIERLPNSDAAIIHVFHGSGERFSFGIDGWIMRMQGANRNTFQTHMMSEIHYRLNQRDTARQISPAPSTPSEE